MSWSMSRMSRKAGNERTQIKSPKTGCKFKWAEVYLGVCLFKYNVLELCAREIMNTSIETTGLQIKITSILNLNNLKNL